MRRPLCVTLCLAAAGLIAGRVPSPLTAQERAPVERPLAAADPLRSAAAPSVREIALPEVPGAHAIWGSTGRDSRGHVWFGISVGSVKPDSANLLEFDPVADRVHIRGNVVDALKRAGVYRPGEDQAKIHSRIVQAGDGHLYFASMDEGGENEDGSKLPTWGGHLWRYRIATGTWDHLLTTKEALIAAAGSQRYVYALGYFGHVLYQYDTRTGHIERREIGSVDGHITRNFVVDRRGHVFVPRLTREAGEPKGPVHVTLVELDTSLAERAATPLEHYLGQESPTECHGIIAFQPMRDGTIYFATHTGFVYRIAQPAAASATAAVTPVGWLHAEGSRYSASLFSPDGTRSLMGVSQSRRPLAGQLAFEWVVLNLQTGERRAFPFGAEITAPRFSHPTLLYGSAAMDNDGRMYVVGIADNDPVLFQVTPAAAAG